MFYKSQFIYFLFIFASANLKLMYMDYCGDILIQSNKKTKSNNSEEKWQSNGFKLIKIEAAWNYQKGVLSLGNYLWSTVLLSS